MLIWAVAAAVFFRIPLLSGFAMVSGNAGDGLQSVYVHEHLYQWLLGRAAFGSPPIYYPQPHVLGYSDAYPLDLPLYAGLRLFGLDPFLSDQLMLVALSLLCFWCAWHLLSKHARIGPYIALGAAALIAFPNDLFLKANLGHLNAFALYYIAPIAAIAASGLRKFPRITPGGAALIVSASALYALLFSTRYYLAWMFALTVLIAGVYSGLTLRQRIMPWAVSN